VAFKLTEEPPNSLVLLGDSQFVELATLLKHFDLIKELSQMSDHTESEPLSEEIGDEVDDSNLAIFVQTSLYHKVFANTILSDLIQYGSINVKLSGRGQGLLKWHLVLQIFAKTDVLTDLLNLVML
jgi:hypothetical protein